MRYNNQQIDNLWIRINKEMWTMLGDRPDKHSWTIANRCNPRTDGRCKYQTSMCLKNIPDILLSIWYCMESKQTARIKDPKPHRKPAWAWLIHKVWYWVKNKRQHTFTHDILMLLKGNSRAQIEAVRNTVTIVLGAAKQVEVIKKENQNDDG